MTATLHTYVGEKAVCKKLMTYLRRRNILSTAEMIKHGHYQFTMLVPHTLDEEGARRSLNDAMNATGYFMRDSAFVWTANMEALNTGTQHLGRALRPAITEPAEIKDWTLADLVKTATAERTSNNNPDDRFNIPVHGSRPFREEDWRNIAGQMLESRFGTGLELAQKAIRNDPVIWRIYECAIEVIVELLKEKANAAG